MELGQLYRSSEVIGAGQDLPHAGTPEAWAGQPGVRAPHAWIIYQGETISTVDLFTGGFVLLSSNPAWRELIMSVHRHRPLDEALQLLDSVAPWSEHIVAVGMGGPEAGCPPGRFKLHYLKARALGYRATANAGEEGRAGEEMRSFFGCAPSTGSLASSPLRFKSPSSRALTTAIPQR